MHTHTPVLSFSKVTYEEAYNATLEYFNGDELAANVWINKYALKDSADNLFECSPDDMHRRMAREIARIELAYPNPMSEDEVYKYIRDFRYIVPQGGPMTGIGNPFQIASLSNCFVIGNERNADSYGGIMKIDEEQVQLMKRRGGVGHDLSHIRPKGSEVKNSALTSTGLVPFMERYSNSTREVAQDGRRGALMLSVDVRHPDAVDFIDAKLDRGKITGANISVKLDDHFMQAVVDQSSYNQYFPTDKPGNKAQKTVNAADIWKKIIHNAWESAEPGVLFWDTIIRESIPDCYADLGYRTTSTNPCGEIPLCPYDSCRLLAINLLSYVDRPFTPEADFDFEKFRVHARTAQRIMDDIIDLEIEKIDAILAKIGRDPEMESIKEVEHDLWIKIRKKAVEGRRAGIGITAEGDMLAAMGLRFGSEEAIDFSVEVHKTMALAVYKASVDLARERGAFGIYDPEREKENPFIQRLKEADPSLYFEMTEHGRRNIALLTIAPTGTTSLMTQTSSGIEPVFMPVYKRRRKVNPNDRNAESNFIDDQGDAWEEYKVFHRGFKTWLKLNGHEDPESLADDVLESLLKKSPYHLATANEIDWKQKVKMQGLIQKWIDHSISVTINLPSDVKEEVVSDLYMTAWKSGCKGVTVYRDGSRTGVLISDDTKDKSDQINGTKFPTKRPVILQADVVRFQNNKEKWIAFIGLIDNKPYEIFTGLEDDEDGLLLPRWVDNGLIIKSRMQDGNSRYDFQFKNKRGYKTTIEGLSHKFNPEYWNYAKLISGTLRHGMPIHKLIDLIHSLHLDSESINTWKNGVVRALKRYVANGTAAKGQTCENCNSSQLEYQEGCLMCKNCGSSKCS